MHTTTPQGLTAVAERVTLGRDRILTEIRKVIVGQDAVIEQVLMALFTGGHCLITGVPGSGVTSFTRQSLPPMIATPDISTAIPSGTMISTPPMMAMAVMSTTGPSISACRRSSTHPPMTASAVTCSSGRQRPLL